jgi:protein tyrosine/serine phosphatase
MFKGDIATPRGRMAAWSDSLFVDHSVFRLVWSNWSAVVPERMYRCNHPTAWRLAAAQRRLGIKTVINLRGQRACGSDALSREAAAKLGLRHIDMAFESRGAPHRERILRFHAICQDLVEPALMHCKSGADRAGLASGLYLMFQGGSSRDALAQLSWRFGHWTRSRTGILDAFFLRYAAEAEGRIPFLDWVRDEYDETALKKDFVAGGLSSFVVDRVLRRE